MLVHFLKIAFRNMWKYRSQTLISVIGLGVGFTCFALATLWIRYEMTYDSFPKNAKQMYVVFTKENSQTGYTKSTSNPLAAYLKETFPEIVNSTRLIPLKSQNTISVDGIDIPAKSIFVDSSIFRMFDVKILEGNLDFLIPGSRKCAITQEKALKWFGNDNPIGKEIGGLTIGAVVSGMAGHSNYPFDILRPYWTSEMNPDQEWRSSSGANTIIELLPGTNLENFEKKLTEHVFGEGRDNFAKKLTIKPLTKLRYTDLTIPREVKIQHILIFAISGMMVVLCSLFNYLTLFASRFRIRQKELALRMVCGASGRSLLVMLSTEFMLTLLFAVLLGCYLTQLFHIPFQTLSDIQMELSAIYRESLVYIGGVILVSLFAFWLILVIFKHKSLDLSMRQSNKKMFRKISVVVQLFISIGFVFCTIVLLKQMYFLYRTDALGFSFLNRGSAMVEKGASFADRLKLIPEVYDVVDAKGLHNILPQERRWNDNITSWDDMPVSTEQITIEQMSVSPAFCAFYDFHLVAGEMLTDEDPETMVLLNEEAVKAFGWFDPLGKQFGDKYTVKGVIKHVYNFAPTIPAKPVFYKKPYVNSESLTVVTTMGDQTERSYYRLVVFKYHEGTWKSCKEKIEQLIAEYNISHYNSGGIYNAEEIYDEYLKSERVLIKLLSIVSVVCVLICVFGFVSLVSLTCEERRKAIAIRKINGATVGNILAMFIKEYALLLVIGAAIAFPTAFFIMKRWIEQYVKQTSIPAWVYLSILFVMALLIVLCVGWQVYKTSKENPAEVINN